MLKTLIVNLVISLGVGGLSSILTRDSMDIYSTITLPPFAPPSSLFPIMWTILYILMAISATIIYRKSSSAKSLVIYAPLDFSFVDDSGILQSGPHRSLSSNTLYPLAYVCRRFELEHFFA